MDPAAALIWKYFPGLSDEQRERILLMGPLYKSWNQKINLISRKDIDTLYERHILHSLAIAKFIEFEPGTKVLDVGTGGGFPGIPLAIFFPQVHFTLIDSIGKKIKVVEEITKRLQLENVKAMNDRVEKTGRKYDFIVARAVTKITRFYSWTKSKILTSFTNDIPNGILYLKGGNLEEELKDFNRFYEIIDLKLYFQEPFFETKKLVFIPFVN